MTTYGFLHTAPDHVPVFTRLLDEISPGDEALHIVDASLLTDARRRGGVDDDLRRRISGRLAELTAGGALSIICTCSTIGGAVERNGRALGRRTLRVDRPMAEKAVAVGERIAVVAALESTLAPTRQLLDEVAAAAGRQITVVEAPCLDAWPHFEQGDADGYRARLARHVEALDGTVDVIVLAQASMAAVEDLVSLETPLLSSPRPAVEALVGR